MADPFVKPSTKKWGSEPVISFKSDKPSEDVLKPDKVKEKSLEILPTRVSNFDRLIMDGGLERGSTTLISGGCGTGKTTFTMQSLYHGAQKGEKGVFISFEEEPHKIKKHMYKNYGWDFRELEKQGKVAVVKFDPTKIARSVEGQIAQKTG